MPLLRDVTVKTYAVHEFHDQEMPPAGLLGVERRHDVGVIEPSRRFDLPRKPFDRLRVVHKLGVNHL